MIKVLSYGDKRIIVNPINGKETTVINVRFAEYGRSGGDPSMSNSSDLLSRIAGENVGLDNIRVHTQSIKEELIGKFPINSEHNLHINRVMSSTPFMRQQQNVSARAIDGKATYFKTYLSETIQEDLDYRIDPNVLAQVRPDLLFGAQLGAAVVKTVEPVATAVNVGQDVSA